MPWKHAIAAALFAFATASAAVPCQADSARGWRSQLRQRLVSQDARSRYGLRVEDAQGNTNGLVVVVHGFNSTPEATAELSHAARQAGFQCGSFAYPNDQPLRDSAELLAGELRRLKANNPECRVSLVTHSMGGLVARAVIEDGGLDQGNVDRLIMVAPPSHGTPLARMAVGTDLWEHWVSRRSGSPWRRFEDSIADGLGEALVDLRPGSDFLTELNARPRNPKVAYTLVLGSGGPVPDAEVEWWRVRVRDALASVRATGAASRFDRWASDLDEVIDGKGDGVIAIKRALLDGVDDVVTLPFGHLEIAKGAGGEGAQQARRIVLDRLLADL